MWTKKDFRPSLCSQSWHQGAEREELLMQFSLWQQTHPTTAPSSVAIAIVPAIASSVLNSDPAAVKVFPIQVLIMRSFARNSKLQYLKRHLDSVISVPPIVKLGKAESLLHRDVPDPAVALQKLLNIPGGFICSKNRGVPFNLLYRRYVYTSLLQ